MTFVPGDLGSMGRAIYSRGDLWLRYEIQNRERRAPGTLAEEIDARLRIDLQPLFVIADTLTLVFGSRERHLESLDARTDEAGWVSARVSELPVSNGQGALVVSGLPAESDHAAVDLIPQYEVGPTHDWLRIGLARGEHVSYYEVAQDMLVGVENGDLVDIFLSRLTITE